MTKRQFLGGLGVLGAALAGRQALSSGGADTQAGSGAASAASGPGGGTPGSFPLVRPEAQWRQLLTPAQYKVLRDHGTERPWTSPLNAEKRHGVYSCSGCSHKLFHSDTKFDSGTGWPSFSQPLKGGVGTKVDTSFFMVRTEVHCANCGGHLGHVFEDGPPPTGLRYCMNGVAMTFQPA